MRHVAHSRPLGRAIAGIIEPLERRMLLSLAPAGAEFRANTFTTNAQDSPAVASDADGDFVVVWQGSGTGDGNGIFAQVYNKAGVPQNIEFRVNGTTTNVQGDPSVAMDADGDFVVAWESALQDGANGGIYAKRFNAAGVPQAGEFLVNTFTTSDQSDPSVAIDASGNFVVAWMSLGQQSAGTRGIYAKRYNAAGVALSGDLHVNTITTDNHRTPAIAMDADGDFVVTWRSDASGLNAQRYNSAGAKVSGEFSVNNSTTTDGSTPSVAMDAAGGFVVIWNGTNIWARRFDSAGVAQGLPFAAITFTTSFPVFSSVAMDADGDFLVTFERNGPDGSSYGVFGQSFNAAGVPQGAEFRVNTFTTNGQRIPAVAMDAAGDAVVAWQSLFQDSPTSYGVYAQRYDHFPGAPNLAGGEFRVNTFTPSNQSSPAMASDSDGDSVVVWNSNGQDGSNSGIYAQRYNAVGVPQGLEFRVNTTTTNSQSNPAVAMDADGDFVVAWSGLGIGNTYGVFAQRYNASGVPLGSEFLVKSGGGFQEVAADDDGNFVVVWRGTGAGDNDGLFARRFDSSGVAQGNEFRINATTTNHQTAASVAMDSDGDFVVTWNTYSGSYPFITLEGVFAQRFNAAAVPQGGEFRVDTSDPFPGAGPSVAMDADGDFVIAWSSYMGPGDSSNGVFAQRYGATGEARGPEFRVNTFTNQSQGGPSIAMGADGDFVIAWVSSPGVGGTGQDGSDQGVFARHFNAAAAPLGAEFRVNTFTTSDQAQPTVALSDDNGLAIAWFSRVQDPGNSFGVYAQRYTVPDAVPVVVASSFATGPVPQRLLFTFSQNVSASLSTSDFVLENLATTQTIPSGDLSLSYDLTTHTATFTYTGSASGTSGILPVGDYRATLGGAGITNSIGTAMGADHLLTFAFPSYIRVGPEFRVGTFTTSVQGGPAIARDADGDFVVAWLGSGAGDTYGVFAQRYNAQGLPQGSEFRVNTFTTGSQSEPAVGMDASGNFVIAWTSFGQDGNADGIYAQRYNAVGVAQGGEFRVNTFITNQQTRASVAMQDNGDFVVVWDGSGASDVTGIFGRRYNAAGVPQSGEFPVNTFTTNSQRFPDVAVDSDGDFVVVWSSGYQEGAGAGYGVYGQRFNASGVPQGTEFHVNTVTTFSQHLAAVAMDADGDFVVTWESNLQDGSSHGIFAQRYSAAGVPQGTEFRVNTTIDDDQSVPDVAMDGSGNFVISWNGRGPGDDFGIIAQRFHSSGVAVGGELRVNTSASFEQTLPAIAMDDSGASVIAWENASFGVFAQRFAPASIVPPAVTASQFLFDTTPHRIEFTFSDDVGASLGTSDFVLQNLTLSQTIPTGLIALVYDTNTNAATFRFTGSVALPDGNYRATLIASGIANPGGTTMAANHVFNFFVLAGDANHDRKIDVADLGILASNWQQSPRTFSQGDFDYSGTVDVNDLGILASKWQQSLTTAPSAAPRASRQSLRVIDQLDLT